MKVDFIKSDQGDWIGMYVDGVLVKEGHSFDEGDILPALGITYTSREIEFDTLDLTSCPYLLSDLEKA